MANATGALLEFYVPCVKFEGLKTNKDVFVGDDATVTLPSTTTIGGQAVVALGDITSSSTTATAFTVTNTGVFTGTNVVAITANSLTTGTAARISVNGITSGHGLVVTSSGTLVTTGDLVSIIGNSATTSTGLLRISGTGLTDGFAVSITGGGANATASGGGISLSLGAATAGTGIAISSTGVYAGTTGLLSVTAASATTGVLATISGAGLTTGTALKISATEATLTTGKYIDCYDGAASDFTVAKYGATTIAGNASGTAALTVSAGDIVVTSGFLVLSANAKGVTFTGTGANGGVLKNLKNSANTSVSGTVKTVEIDIGGTPYYFLVSPTSSA